MRIHTQKDQLTLIDLSQALAGRAYRPAGTVLKATVLLAALVAALWAGLAPLYAEDGVTEEVLGKLHEERHGHRSTPDGLHFAYATVDEAARKAWFVHDGQDGPKFDKLSPFTFSSDGKRFAYRARAGDKRVVVIDGKVSPPYDVIGLPVFSPDGRHVAYPAGDGKIRLVLDGEQADQLWDGIDAVVFSPDGERVAYHAAIGKWEGGDHYMVIDGVPGPRFDVISRFEFSPDSTHAAFLAKKDGKYRLVLDGEEADQLWDRVGGPLVFSPDSRRVAHHAANGDWEGGDHYMVIDGVPGSRFDALTSLVFSPDGKRVAYHAINGEFEGGDHYTVIDGVPGPRFDGLGSAEFSADSKRVAYFGSEASKLDGERSFVVVDGVKGPLFDRIHHSGFGYFSPDGSRFGYAARLGDKDVAVVDGKVGPEYDEIFRLTFSPDGKHVAYVARTGGDRFAIIDGAKGPPFELIWPIVFSPDSKRVAYKAKSGGEYVVVVDGQVGPSYPSIGGMSRSKTRGPGGREVIAAVNGLIGEENPAVELGGVMFSPSGRHVAYFAKIPDDKWRLNLDGNEGPSYDEVGKVAFFESEGYVKYLAGKGDTLIMVTQVLPAGE